MNLVKIIKLAFDYRTSEVSVPIFRDFDLEIMQGDFIAIKGPSGSGKSTLLYLIAGLLNHQDGQILFDGKDISKLSDVELSFIRNQDIAFIFQQFHLMPKLNVLENILLPTQYPIEALTNSHDSHNEALKIAKNLGIDERLDHFPGQLSGGQQQRTAIARALINNPKLILADEPTGNLDSESTQKIIEILQNLNSEGKTIVLITHEDDVAQAANKIFHLKDGKLVREEKSQGKPPVEIRISPKLKPEGETNKSSVFNYLKIFPEVMKSVYQNRVRSALNMLGIVVGVAAVFSMITLGNFTKERILESYASLGANTVVFRGYPSWQLKATDKFPLKFNFFSWDRELLPLKKIFKEIKYISPIMRSWGVSFSYAGKSIEKDAMLLGVSEEGLKIQGRELLIGKRLSPFHIQNKNSVCVIGSEISSRLFPRKSPVGEIAYLSLNQSNFACKVIGVLKPMSSNKEWSKPNLEVYVPFTFFQTVSDNWWQAQIQEVSLELHQGADVEKVGVAIKGLFKRKYGVSGQFIVDSDSVLIAQMNKFLSLFSLLLTAIALVTLGVGGVGIGNMMLVAVSERLKEIGIRKSVGASCLSIRYQFLLEAVTLCCVAGVIGILVGFAAYQGAIYGASKMVSKLQYEWVFDGFAFLMSFNSILLVGVASGIMPALKAEKLQVIEALRSE